MPNGLGHSVGVAVRCDWCVTGGFRYDMGSRRTPSEVERLSDSEQHDGTVSRRDFLRVGGLSVVGWKVAEPNVRAADWVARRRCIFVLMSGGASQLDTFDPKPDAGLGVRGPTRAISTSIPGIQLADSLPLLAHRADRFTLIRSMTHSAAPLHETGWQLIQTGRLSTRELRYPHVGHLVARPEALAGPPGHVILPQPLSGAELTGYVGQGDSFLSERAPVVHAEDAAVVELLNRRRRDWRDGVPQWPLLHRYGDSSFGRRLGTAFSLAEAGVRFVTVNLFDQLHGRRTFDCHGHPQAAPATVFDYRDRLCPEFDRALSALLDDLYATGLIEDTLLVVASEMGRTPQLNARSGRDHWTKAWSAMVAGAGVPVGFALGATDHRAAEVVDRPVEPAELVATIVERMGMYPSADLLVDGENRCPLVDANAISELVG